MGQRRWLLDRSSLSRVGSSYETIGILEFASLDMAKRHRDSSYGCIQQQSEVCTTEKNS
jgi:hypothetical protein